jgi:hypothetical protein
VLKKVDIQYYQEFNQNEIYKLKDNIKKVKQLHKSMESTPMQALEELLPKINVVMNS